MPRLIQMVVITHGLDVGCQQPLNYSYLLWFIDIFCESFATATFTVCFGRCWETIGGKTIIFWSSGGCWFLCSWKAEYRISTWEGERHVWCRSMFYTSGSQRYLQLPSPISHWTTHRANARIEPVVDIQLSQEQASLCRDRSTVEQGVLLTQHTSRMTSQAKKANAVFVDLAAAYDGKWPSPVNFFGCSRISTCQNHQIDWSEFRCTIGLVNC